MKIVQGEEFIREFKKLRKKYPSLLEDLAVLEKVILKFPFGDDSRHSNTLKREGDRCICKRRMMCRAVRGSEFRVIYYYDGKILEFEYIEIYFKGNKEAEDKKRVEMVWQKRREKL